MRLSTEDLAARARELSWLLLDVDGVLTSGLLIYSQSGEELKLFHVKDGFALKLAPRQGIQVGLLSGRDSKALRRRAEELGLQEVTLGRQDKAAAFDEFLERQGVEAQRVAYIGDDLPDLPVLTRCGLSLAPADAVAEVRNRVHRVLDLPGGGGAVREAVQLILKARGEWPEVVAGFLAPR